jgi:integrase
LEGRNPGHAAAMDDRSLRRLTEPPIKPKAGPALADFPAGLRAQIEAYFAGLIRVHRGFSGRRNRPCQPASIRTRRAELMAVARMAVRLGTPIEKLTSLATLLHPDVVETVIDAYWQQNGEEPKVFTIDLGWKLLRIARETGCLDQAALDRLDDIRASLEHYRRFGLTPKNMQLVRQVLTEGIWSEVVSLPNVLMQQARSANDHAPTKAPIMAQLAVAIAILTFAPIRVSNLVTIELGENLIKPGGPSNSYWLVFPHYDVKNRVDLNFQLDQLLTELIDEYVDVFRPALLRANSPWLFPGEGAEPKTVNTFGIQITERIERAIGLRITPHQFRHAAAAIYLKHRPGDYETVRRLLGHKNIKTTVDFYCGLQTTQATEEFGKLIREKIEFEPDE